MKRVLDDVQLITAARLYFDEHRSTNEIGEAIGCSGSTIARSLQRAGYELRDVSHAKIKYPLNETVFDQIDTEEKAYWLGFLYADGNISSVSSRVRLSLAEEDREILLRFSTFVFGQDRIKFYKQPPSRPNSQNTVYVDVCNKHVAQRLTEIGCPPKKTFLLTFPQWLDKRLHSHFVRGYFDGDGSLSIYTEKRKGRGTQTKSIVVSARERADFTILSTLEFCLSVKEILAAMNINARLSQRHKERMNNNWTLTVRGERQIERLMDWIYEDATIYLRRKYDKYLRLAEINRDKDKTT